MKFSVSVLALLLTASAVQAADLVIEEPVVIDEVASSGVRGVIELGALAQYADQTSDPFDGWAGGGYISAAIWGGDDGFVWGIDGYFDANSFSSTDFAPNYVGVVGAHLGVSGDAGMFGVFGSVGAMPEGPDDEPQFGYAVGVEGMVDLSGIGLFGQIGYADARVEPADSGFTGFFGRVGALFTLSDDIALMIDGGYGYSTEFTSSDEDGSYATAGIKAAFALPTDFDAFVTVGYEGAFYDAIGDDDTGVSHTAKLGISIPFGDGNSAASALNPLATTVAPYRAGSWADTLD